MRSAFQTALRGRCRARVIATMLSAVAILGCRAAAAQELLSLGETCSYYGEEIVDAVYGFESDRDAESAVEKIVDYTGLPQNFKIMAANVPNAAADVDANGERRILYNQTFMKRITETAQTDWAATSILAHEIGHHLSGHTLKRGGSRPELELQADAFSGYVLFKMGAELEDAQAAMEALAEERSSETHPPKSARLAAIANGWKRANEQTGGASPSVQPQNTAEKGPSNTAMDERETRLLQCLQRKAEGENVDCSSYQMPEEEAGLHPEGGFQPQEGQFQPNNNASDPHVAHCHFTDGSMVAVDRNNRLLAEAEGLVLDVGQRRSSTDARVQYELYITSNDLMVAALLAAQGVYNVTYYVDVAGTIWRPDGLGGFLQIGSCQ